MRRFSLPLFAALAAAILILSPASGCNCSGSIDMVPPCESDDPPPACGTMCETLDDCGLGTYCDKKAGECTADCAFGSDVRTCPNPDEYCNQFGRCTPGFPTTDGGGKCADVTLMTMPTTPTVMLLVDQSGSMTEPYPGGDRWTVLRDALMDPGTGLVASMETSVRFGLTLYSYFDGGPICPILTVVPPSLNNYMAINMVYQAEIPIEDTPTGEALDAVVADLVPFPEPGPKIIVLATDGEPDTCAVPDPQTGQPEAIAAAVNANANGIDVFIISVGEGVVSLGHLQDMANAGIGLPVGGATNAPFWEATDQTDLINAFQSIVSGVLSCTLDLNGMINTMTAGMGNVTLDGTSLGFMDPDGWEVVDTDTIRLVGAACTTLQDGGSHTVTATFPCGVIL